MARQSEPQIPVLVTRPRAEGAAFAASLTARFGSRVRAVLSPLIAPQQLVPTISAHTHAAVVFTSAQAVVASRPLRASLPRLAWCVGRKTASVAAEAGFLARSADGDLEALARAIIGDPPNGRILYLRGVDTHGNLKEMLEDSGLYVDVAIVYAQVPQPLASEAMALLCRPAAVVVPLFSPRSAGLFRAALPPDAAARLHIAAMSGAVASALADLPRSALCVAQRPDADSMLDAVETLLVGLAPP